MYPDIPFWLSIVFVLGGFAVLAWSANAFVDGASAVAKAFGVSPFIIGMVIIGFGTSAPELCVSALSGAYGHSDLSLGNAYGCFLVTQGNGFSRGDGVILLAVFFVLLPLYCWFDQSQKKDESVGAPGERARPTGKASGERAVSLWKAWLLLVLGLVFLVGSSHVLVWGSVDLARRMGVSELLIGLTIIAVGTSLPELASAVVSARKGEHEFVLGNIVGSNFFNTLAVVGLAGAISPFKDVSPYILTRDMPVTVLVSLSIAVFGCNYRRLREPKAVGRVAGAFWLLCFAAYMALMLSQELK